MVINLKIDELRRIVLTSLHTAPRNPHPPGRKRNYNRSSTGSLSVTRGYRQLPLRGKTKDARNFRPGRLLKTYQTAAYFGSSSETSAFSSCNSFTVASILARLKSFTGTFWTISSVLPFERTGNEQISPFSMP